MLQTNLCLQTTLPSDKRLISGADSCLLNCSLFMKTHFKTFNAQCFSILNAYVINLTYSTQSHFIRCCFQLLSLGAVLDGINHLVFQKELILKDSLLISPYTQHLLWMKIGLRCGGWWFISFAPQSLLFNSKEILVKSPFFITCYNFLMEHLCYF